jgi:hypothetical protein
LKKQILIEKYIEPSEITKNGDCWISEFWYNEYEELHSILGHPAIVNYYDGEVAEKAWFENGLLNRDRDLPASIDYVHEKMTCQYWFKKNCSHRDGDKPADIIYDENGKIIEEWWYKNDLQHRDGNKPTVINYDEKGEITLKVWYKKGKFIKRKLF